MLLKSIAAFSSDIAYNKVWVVLQNDIINRANKFISLLCITITVDDIERSAGGVHDFFLSGILVI